MQAFSWRAAGGFLRVSDGKEGRKKWRKGERERSKWKPQCLSNLACRIAYHHVLLLCLLKSLSPVYIQG
jgi:hypothetical protein